MNKELKNRLKEAGNFIICLIVLLVAGYYTGFLKGFAPEDFVDAYQNIVLKVSTKTHESNERRNILSTGNSNTIKGTSYKNYRPKTIPDTVLRGVYESNTWTNIFNSEKKAVFYLYDSSDSRYSNDFNIRMTNYLNTKDNKPYYTNFSVSLSYFKNIKAGMIGPSKICDSFEECNEQRMRASDYSNMAEFFNRCGQTVCIIKPETKQYIILKDRNFGSAVQVLNNLRKW